MMSATSFIAVSFVFLLIFLVRILTVFIHELGHAIPALILTRKKVSIYIGSYSGSRNSARFQIGLLEVWFSNNPFSWLVRGLCEPSADGISFNDHIVITILGPLASIIIAAIASFIAFTFDGHESVKILLIFFFVSAVVDLIVNLTPKRKPITLADGRLTYNDGASLQMLFAWKRVPKKYFRATELYFNEIYQEAASLFEQLLSEEIKLAEAEIDAYRLAISSYQLIDKYQRALEIHKLYEAKYVLNWEDYSIAGFIKYNLELHHEAIGDYQKSLTLNPHNLDTLNGLGSSYIEIGQYAEAIIYFDRAINIDSNFEMAHFNRSLAKDKLDQTKSAFQDTE